MKNKLFLFALLTVLIFGMSSCEDDERERKHPFTVNNAPLTFLKVGNEWVYQVETWEYYNWGERSFDTVKLKIVSQSGNYYKVIKNDEEENYEYWYYDGEVFKVEIEEIGNEGSLFLYRNLESWREWNYNDSITVGVATDWFFHRKDTVPAGTFFTFRINMQHIHSWSLFNRSIRFNKGVGIVREERIERYWVKNDNPSGGYWSETNYNITLISKNF